MRSLIRRLYYNRFVSRIFHTLVYSLQKELRDCESVLDLGCGPSSPLQYCKSVRFSVGVEIFKPYYDETRRRQIHTEYLQEEITHVDFKEKSFDAVILIGVLEHFPKEEGKAILQKAERWAKKKVIVSCPNGYLPQGQTDGNPHQVHRSGWEVKEMRRRGYTPYGMAGWKFLRKEKNSESMQDANAIFSTLRFRPRIFWMILSEFTQAVVYYLPSLAFEVFSVKEITE